LLTKASFKTLGAAAAAGSSALPVAAPPAGASLLLHPSKESEMVARDQERNERFRLRAVGKFVVTLVSL
jgi:hypothetical protein